MNYADEPWCSSSRLSADCCGTFTTRYVEVGDGEQRHLEQRLARRVNLLVNAGIGLTAPNVITVLPSGWRRTLPSPNDLHRALEHGGSIGRCQRM